MKLIQELLIETAAKVEPFIASDGSKNDGVYRGTQPNLSWKVPDQYSIFRRGPRGDEDKAKSKEVLNQLKKDLDGYKRWVKDNPTPYAKEKEQTIKNCERVMAACLHLDSKMDSYNEIIGKANKIADEKTYDDAEYAEEIGKLSGAMTKLCRELSDTSKDVNIRQGLPPFMSKFRTVAAQRLALMFKSRDNMELVAKRAKMSPKQREAAQKASVRMKMAWGI